MDGYNNKASSSNENRVMKFDEDWEWKSNTNTESNIDVIKNQYNTNHHHHHHHHHNSTIDTNITQSVNNTNNTIKNNVNNSSNNNNSSSSSKPRRRIFRWPLICQVDGCGSDLSALKEYHQRYKICEHHLKVNHIIKNGEKHRFCQQCGRFHVLAEFDGVKRSCRTRLERHNKRRRIKEMAKKRRRVNTYPYNDVNIYKNDVTAHNHAKLSDAGIIMPNQNLTNPNLVKSELFNIKKEPFSKCIDYNQNHQQMNLRQQQQQQQCEDEAIAEVFTHYAQSNEAYELWQALQSSKCNTNHHHHHHHHEKTQCQSLDYPSDIMNCNNINNMTHDIINTSTLNGNNNNAANGVNTSQAIVTSTSIPMSQSSSSSSQLYYPRLGANNTLYSYNFLSGTEGIENSFSGSYGEGNSNIHMKCQPNGAAAGAAMMVSSTPNIYLGNVVPKVEDVQQEMDTSHSSDDEQQKQHQQQQQQQQSDRPDALYDSLLKLTSLSVKVFNCTPANLPQSMRRELLGAVRNGLVPEEYMRPGLIDCDSIVLN